MNFNDPDLYERHRTIAHECGHATVAWLSPIVMDIEHIWFSDGDGGGGATKMHYLISDTANTCAELILIRLAGMAGEGIVWGKIRGGASANDLFEARESAERLLRLTTIGTLRQWWDGRSDSKLDVAGMFAQPPPPPIGEPLNLGYRRARRRIIDIRAGSDRLCALAVGKRVVTREEIQSQFGPRLWGPGGR